MQFLAALAWLAQVQFLGLGSDGVLTRVDAGPHGNPKSGSQVYISQEFDKVQAFPGWRPARAQQELGMDPAGTEAPQQDQLPRRPDMIPARRKRRRRNCLRQLHILIRPTHRQDANQSVQVQLIR